MTVILADAPQDMVLSLLRSVRQCNRARRRVRPVGLEHEPHALGRADRLWRMLPAIGHDAAAQTEDRGALNRLLAI